MRHEMKVPQNRICQKPQHPLHRGFPGLTIRQRMRTGLRGMKKSWVQIQKQSLEKRVEWGALLTPNSAATSPESHACSTPLPEGRPLPEDVQPLGPPALRILYPTRAICPWPFREVRSVHLRCILQSGDLPWGNAINAYSSRLERPSVGEPRAAPPEPNLPEEKGQRKAQAVGSGQLTMLRCSFLEAELAALRAGGCLAGEAPSDILHGCC